MYLLAPFILQNFKRILRVDSDLSERAIFRHKVAHLSCPEQFIFLVQIIITTFIYLLALFIVQNLQKIITVDPKLWGCPTFGSKMVHLPHFFWKIIIIFIYYPLSLCKISKKFFQWIQNYEDVQFFGIKWIICLNEIFFRKPVNETCSFHSCLSTCQKSKWGINLLVKYWRLKNTEISLTESLENQGFPKHAVFAEC